MAIIPTVGRKTWSLRLLIGMLYLALTMGAATMVYPFLVMLATSVKSGVDANQYEIIPRYFYDDAVLFAKYAEIKFAGDIEAINDFYQSDFAKLEDVVPPRRSPLTAGQRALVRDWNKFAASLDMTYKQANYGPTPGTGYAPSRLLDEYRKFLRNRFHNDINLLNKVYREENTSFEQVLNPFERSARREWQPEKTRKVQEWLRFEATLPPDFLRVVGCDALFVRFLKEDKYDGNIHRLNATYGTQYRSFTEVRLAPSLPTDKRQRPDWEEFMRTVFPFRFMKLSREAVPAYRRYIARRYLGDIREFNRIYGTAYQSFEEVNLPSELPSEGTPLTDWMDFIAKAAPAESFRAENAENLFRRFVLHKYGTLETVNHAYGTQMRTLMELAPPYQLADWAYVLENRRSLRWHFIARNYSTVANYMLVHGRAVFNTAIFCLAVILTHLIVNPLCAYSLSRYNLRYTYKVLLFLLATMAFPAEVALIPNFLLLKKLHLLNTFWALILPGMANGFSIFLLKGFFDSLPRELYEAGVMDGASEQRMFWQITVPLSKPIFAVIALQSFVAAYGAFMFAFLVCQNPKMWTMMVWLYQLQITAPKYVTMAALTLAAVPTLTVFVFAQNVIMRGIILPSFK